MKGIFFRELRESVKWGAIILIVVLWVVLHDIRNMLPMILYELAGKNLIVLAPLAGLLLGVTQSLFELKSDNWAFAVHRPVSRRGIFIAKCAAGLLVLYVSLAIPCAYDAIWAAIPGHQASPFQARMLLPLVANILVAGCYYFAAMVLILRKARWYGTRIFPVFLSLATSAAVAMLIPEFWQAVVVILAVQAVGAVAAWGAFAENGAVESHPLSRLALAILLYPGALAIGTLITGLGQTFAPGNGPWGYYQIDRQGNPVRTTLSIDHGTRHWTLSDPAGHPIPQYEGIDIDDPANANTFIRLTARLYDEHSIRWPTSVQTDMTFQTPLPGTLGLPAVAPPGTRLRFSASYNVERQVIELYDPISRLPLGTVGPDGFARADAAVTRVFPGTPLSLTAQRGRRTLPFASVVYWLELDKSRVVPVFTAQPDEPIISAGDVGPPAGPSILVATPHHLHLVRPSGEVIFSTPHETDPKTDFYQAALLANGNLIIQVSTIPGIRRNLSVLEFSPSGQLVRQTELPPLPILAGSKRYETAMLGAIFPVAALPLVPRWALDEVIDTRAEGYPMLFTCFVLGSTVLAAILTAFLAWRYALGARHTILWTIASVLLGLPTLGAFLGLHDKPATEKCPACGSRRLADRRLCPRCAAPLPPPPLDGTEIFEPQESLPAMAGLAL